MPGVKLTASDIKKIQEEIDYRKITLGPELREKLKTARAQGDLSENFEYTMAKRNNNKNLSRIRYLENMIKGAQVIEDHADEDQVGINKAVTFLEEGEEEEETVKIVTSIRGDSLQGRISDESPLGRALMGHRVGETVTVRVNDTMSYTVEIKKVVPVEDDGSDGIRQF